MNENEINSNVEQNVQNNIESLPMNDTIPETVPEVSETNNTLTEPEKPKKKGGLLKGLIIFLIIVLIIGGIIFGGYKLYKKLTTIEDPFPDIDTIGKENTDTTDSYDIESSFSYNLENDYSNGTINTDEYLSQLAYSIFEPNKLDSKYQSLDIDYANPRDLFEKFSEYSSELSADTYAYIFNKYIGDYIEWDDEDSGVSKNTSSTSYEIQKVARGGESTTSPYAKLTKVKLSSKGHFLLYYTDSGRNAISDDKVEKLANHLEKVLVKYEKNYGVKFTYKNGLGSGKITKTYAEMRAEKLLEKNGIDKKYVVTAMPIYLVDLSYLDTPAFYVGSTYFGSLNADDIAKLAATIDSISPGWLSGDDSEQMQTSLKSLQYTYAVPYININANEQYIEDAELISAHELFHHFQYLICGDGSYKKCQSDLFTLETTANLASAYHSDINKIGTALTAHSHYYNLLTETSIDNVGKGYAAFTFANNYAEVVPNGMNTIFQSIKYKDTLDYLYSNSKGKYKDAMLLTAERSLTLDYKNKQLLPYSKNNSSYPTYPKAHGSINVNHRENIHYSSSQYYYVKPSDLLDYKMYLKAGEYTDHEITVLFFVQENNKYRKVYSQSLDDEFVISFDDWTAYDKIAISIVETSISNKDAYYNINTSTSSLIPNKVTITPKSLGLKEPTKSKTDAIMCYKIENEEIFETGYQVYVNLDNNQKIDDMILKGTVRFKNYDPNDPVYKFAKNTATAVLFAVRIKYKEQFKSVRINTYDTGDSYYIILKVKKNFDEAFRNSFNAEPTDRQSIINAIEAQGFICE